MTTIRVLCQQWEESERDWGTRPDGYSLHASPLALRAFIKEYWDGMPDEVPDEYSRPCGQPYSVEVAPEVAAQIVATTNGLRCYDTAPQPPAGNLGAWRHLGNGVSGLI